MRGIQEDLPDVGKGSHQRGWISPRSSAGREIHPQRNRRFHHHVVRSIPRQIDQRRLSREKAALRHYDSGRKTTIAPLLDALVTRIQLVGRVYPRRCRRTVLRPTREGRLISALRPGAPSRPTATAKLGTGRGGAERGRKPEGGQRIDETRVHRQSRTVYHPRIGWNGDIPPHSRDETLVHHDRPTRNRLAHAGDDAHVADREVWRGSRRLGEKQTRRTNHGHQAQAHEAAVRPGSR